jgi:hypothetical protein
LLASILNEDAFRPAEPHSIEETGLTASLIETLMLKYVALIGSASGRQIADNICLPLPLLEPIYQSLRQRQLFVHTGSTAGDYIYTLTDQGRQRASGYGVVAPISERRRRSTNILSRSMPSPSAGPRRAPCKSLRRHLRRADLLDTLGPAINSGAGLFLYGARAGATTSPSG